MRRLTIIPLPAALAVAVLGACLAEEPQAPDTEHAHLAGDEPAEASAESPGEVGLPPVLGDPAFTKHHEDPDIEWGPCPEFMPDDCELAVIQGDPEEPNADVYFKLEPGTTAPEHWHTSNERMVLVSGEMEVDYEGQDPVDLTPGTYAYGPAELPHETHCLGEAGDEPCILFIAFEDPVDAIEGQPDEVPDTEAFTVTVDEVDAADDWGDCPPFMPETCGLAVVQGDPEEENADAFFKLQPETTASKHWHTSAERMVLLSGDMRVNFDGQPPVELSPMTYAYGPPKLPHDTRCGDGEECVLFIAFEEPVDAHDVRGGNRPHHH